MKILSYSIIMTLSLLCQSCYSQDSDYISSSRLSLQNYGFSYCMKIMAQENNISHLDYARAQGIYFENGNHNDPNIYEKIHSYIKENVKKHNFKGFKNNNITYSCLELYDSKKYKLFIESFDKYITKNIV